MKNKIRVSKYKNRENEISKKNVVEWGKTHKWISMIFNVQTLQKCFKKSWEWERINI